MEVIRKTNPGAYRQPRWHYAADANSTRTICGRDVADVKGDRRGSYRAGRIERGDADESLARDGYVCAACRRKVEGGGSIKLSHADMRALLARASEAGEQAFRDAIPTPMVVGTPKDMMASLMGRDDGGFDPNEPTYYVSEGVCGMAWVNVKPGGSRFARWLVKEGYAHARAYRGGVHLSLYQLCGDRGSQSYARWDAAATAVAGVLRDAGITAYAESRLD